LVDQGRQALIGSPGVGKTWVALAYVNRHQDQYDAIFWLSAASADALNGAWRDLATFLGVSDSEDFLRVRDAVRHRLPQVYRRWLLVFDGAQHAAMLAEYLPVADSGHVLLTSADCGLGALGIHNPIQLRELSPADGTRLLLERTRRREITGDQELVAARTLAEVELGCFPLAIEQAASYIENTYCSFSDYLTSYRKRHFELLELGVPVDYPRSLLSAVAKTLEQPKGQLAVELARIVAFLDADAVPRSFVFTAAAEFMGRESSFFSKLGQDPLAFDEAMAPNLRYSLVVRDVSSGDYRMHRLIRLAVRHLTQATQKDALETAAIRACSIEIEEPDLFGDSGHHKSMYGLSCARLVLRRGASTVDDAQVLRKVSSGLRYASLLPEAAQMIEAARYILMRDRGRGDRDTLACTLTLAKFREIETRLEQTITLYSEVLSESNPVRDLDMISIALNNMGELLRRSGDLGNALKNQLRSLAARRQLFGESHLAVSTALNNIGNVHSDAGALASDGDRLKLAHSYYEKSYAIRKRLLRSPHHLLANSLNNLGHVRFRLKWFKAAEAPLKDALAMWESLYGPAHSEVATTLGNLAQLYRATKRKAEARVLEDRAKEIADIVLNFQRSLASSDGGN